MTAGRPADVVDQVRSVVAANVAGTVDLLARIDAVVRRAVAERPPAPPDARDVLSRLLDAGLASYAEVNKHVLALLDGLVSVAERALLPPAAGAPATVPAPAVDVRLEGRPGERVPCPFVVENQYDRPVEVTFRAGPLSAPGRPDVSASAVAFEPARLRVEAGAAEVATAVVTVVPDLAPGATYVTTVEVVGFEGRRVGVALAVADADASAEVATLVPRSASRAVERTRAPRRRAGGAAR